MAKNVTTKLSVQAGGKSYTFSNTKGYTDEKVVVFNVDNTDTFNDLIQFNPEDDSPASPTAMHTSSPKSFCLYNSGTTAVEVQLNMASWTHGAPDSLENASRTHSMILTAGEMFFSNSLRMIRTDADNSSASGGYSALALASDKVSTALTTTVARGGDMNANIDGEDAAGATAIAVNDGAERFKVGDYIYVDATTDDVFRVTATDGTTGLTVERGVLGYTAQTLQNTSDIYMYAGTHLHDKNGAEDDAGVNIRTDSRGRFKGQLLGDGGEVPRGTSATDVAGGIVPGSVAIQFPLHGSYAELGLDIGASQSSGLTGGTTYEFRLVTSLGTTADIAFTADSSDQSYGKVVSQIQTAIDDAGLDFLVQIIAGDIRFTSKKQLSGDTLTFEDPSDGTNLWGSGNFPAKAAGDSDVPTRYPQETITDINTGKKIKNTAKMLIDDGNGNLLGDVGSGTIDYESGVIDMVGPYRSEFKTSFSYASAHAGVPTSKAVTPNIVGLISARSVNAYKNGEITLISYS